MENTLINQNQLRYFDTTLQDNPFSESPLYIITTDGDFLLPLNVDRTNFFAETRTPTSRELQECPHILMTLPRPCYPHSVRFPQSSRSVQEEVEMRRSNNGAIDITGRKFDDNCYDNPQDSNGFIFDLNTFSKRIISSAKVTEIPRVISEVKFHDVSASRTF